MRYIAQQQHFNSLADSLNLKKNVRDVYYALFFANNRLHWAPVFTMPCRRLMVLSKINSIHTVRRIEKILIDLGLLIKLETPPRMATRYHLVDLVNEEWHPKVFGDIEFYHEISETTSQQNYGNSNFASNVDKFPTTFDNALPSQKEGQPPHFSDKKSQFPSIIYNNENNTDFKNASSTSTIKKDAKNIENLSIKSSNINFTSPTSNSRTNSKSSNNNDNSKTTTSEGYNFFYTSPEEYDDEDTLDIPSQWRISEISIPEKVYRAESPSTSIENSSVVELSSSTNDTESDYYIKEGKVSLLAKTSPTTLESSSEIPLEHNGTNMSSTTLTKCPNKTVENTASLKATLSANSTSKYCFTTDTKMDTENSPDTATESATGIATKIATDNASDNATNHASNFYYRDLSSLHLRSNRYEQTTADQLGVATLATDVATNMATPTATRIATETATHIKNYKLNNKKNNNKASRTYL